MNDYLEFKKNVLLDPIQNVVVVDDKFPTYKQLIDGGVPAEYDTELALSLFSHYSGKGCLCVVENAVDASGVGDRIPGSLSNADLLILDYHLIEGSDDGSKACEILSTIAKSSSFNIVVVYTAGPSTTGDLAEIALEIASSLKEWPEQEEDLDAINLIDELEADNPGFSEDLSGRLDDTIVAGYLSGVALRSAVYAEPVGFLENLIAVPSRKYISKILNIFLQKKVTSAPPFSATKNLTVLLEDSPIIFAENFLTVVIGKSTKPCEIDAVLEASLEQLQINPIQLSLQGILKEASSNAPKHIASIVSNSELMAGLLLDAAESKDTSLLAERILQEMNTEVVGQWNLTHGASLASSLTSDPLDFLKENAQIDLSKADVKLNVYHELNQHLCTYRSVVSKHLTTGVILQDSQDKYWVVLNCSCDLVPNQQTLKWKCSLRGWQPFTALKLIKRACIGSPLKNAEEGRFIFISDGGKKLALSYANRGDNPHYEVFYAQDNGVFDGEEKMVVKSFMAGADAAGFQDIEFKIIGQMRYEYACRFLNMLSAHKSRVGVNYVSFPGF